MSPRSRLKMRLSDLALPRQRGSQAGDNYFHIWIKKSVISRHLPPHSYILGGYTDCISGEKQYIWGESVYIASGNASLKLGFTENLIRVSRIFRCRISHCCKSKEIWQKLCIAIRPHCALWWVENMGISHKNGENMWEIHIFGRNTSLSRFKLEWFGSPSRSMWAIRCFRLVLAQQIPVLDSI